LTPASILANVSGRNQITLVDLDESTSLFIDARASAQVMATSNGAIKML
jgi:RuvB-like protein 1 (pontin 52)